jgi:hypothetical protein
VYISPDTFGEIACDVEAMYGDPVQCFAVALVTAGQDVSFPSRVRNGFRDSLCYALGTTDTRVVVLAYYGYSH